MFNIYTIDVEHLILYLNLIKKIIFPQVYTVFTKIVIQFFNAMDIQTKQQINVYS